MKDENCENVVKKHMEKYGHLEVLINNVSQVRVDRKVNLELTRMLLRCK